MKKFAILLALIVSTLTFVSKANDNSPSHMVVEGRTWWYNAPEVVRSERYIGYRIGAPVESNGEDWYPVNQIKFASRYYPTYSDNNEWSIDETEKTICHIRQNGNKVYTRMSSKSITSSNPLYLFYYGPFIQLSYNWPVWEKDINEIADEYVTFEFELAGDAEHEFDYTIDRCYDDTEFTKLRFGESNEISNSGFEYTQYQLTIKDDNEYYRTKINSIPQFGYTIPEPAFDSELFFVPLGWITLESTIYEGAPRLQYVTDADNNILFEALGGLKLWELEEDGIAGVSDEPDASAEVWYTIDGIKIDAPVAPGIYIRHTDAKAEKVVVR